MTNSINVDVVLVLDCTCSMVPWIKMAKEQLLNIFGDVKKDYPTSDIRVGFVGYRDICDSPHQFEIVPLTHDHMSVVEKLSMTEAFGGGDICEDVAGAMRKLNGMKWRQNACRLAFHVADAPAHGMLYHHAYISDDFPQESHGVSLFEEISLLANTDVSLTFISIDSSTEIMTDKFAEYYSALDMGDKFKVINFDYRGPNRGQHLSRMISADINRSISASIGDPSTP